MQFVALVRGGLGVASLAWRRSSLNPAMHAVSAKTPGQTREIAGCGSIRRWGKRFAAALILRNVAVGQRF